MFTTATDSSCALYKIQNWRMINDLYNIMIAFISVLIDITKYYVFYYIIYSIFSIVKSVKFCNVNVFVLRKYISEKELLMIFRTEVLRSLNIFRKLNFNKS